MGSFVISRKWFFYWQSRKSKKGTELEVDLFPDRRYSYWQSDLIPEPRYLTNERREGSLKVTESKVCSVQTGGEEYASRANYIMPDGQTRLLTTKDTTPAGKGVKRKKQVIWKSGSNRSNPSRRAKEGSQEPINLRIGNPEVGAGGPLVPVRPWTPPHPPPSSPWLHPASPPRVRVRPAAG